MEEEIEKDLWYEKIYWNGVRSAYLLYTSKGPFVVSDKIMNKLIDYYNYPKKLKWELEEARAYSREMEQQELEAKETCLVTADKSWYEVAAKAKYAKTLPSPDNYFHWSSTGKKPVSAPHPDSTGDWFQMDGSKWKLMIVCRGMFNGKPRYQFLGINGEAYRWGRICNTIPELFTPSRRCYQRINGPGGVVVEK